MEIFNRILKLKRESRIQAVNIDTITLNEFEAKELEDYINALMEDPFRSLFSSEYKRLEVKNGSMILGMSIKIK